MSKNNGYNDWDIHNLIEAHNKTKAFLEAWYDIAEHLEALIDDPFYINVWKKCKLDEIRDAKIKTELSAMKSVIDQRKIKSCKI